MLDITDELRDAEFQQGDFFSACLPVEEMEVPAPFCFVALVIKPRHICVHRIRREHADAIVQVATDVLPEDVITAIVSWW